MPEQGKVEELPLETIAKIKMFLSSLDGIETFVASHEGLPIETYGYDNPQKAETEAALSEDLLKASTDMITTALGEKPPNRISLLLEQNKTIEIIKFRELVLTIRGRADPINHATIPILKTLKNEKIVCPYCGADLTLETSKCPSCGASVPFLSPQCPHCKADLTIKSCPHCKKTITYDGKKVIISKEITNKQLLVFDSILVGTIGTMIGWLAKPSIITAIIGGILGASGTYLLLRNTFKTKKIKIQED